MTTTTFDTLGYAKKLEEAGFTRPQAEAQASILRDILAMQDEAARKELATKIDVVEAEMKIKAELAEKIESSKHEILKWMMGMLIAQTAMILLVLAFIK